MFSETARYYDKIYAQKDYQTEVERVRAIVNERLHSDGVRLLDVACGTGHHIQYLKENFLVEGLDINEELLEIAQQQNPEVSFHQADMVDFDLGKKYEVLTCLFSSIGYVKTLDNLNKAVASMAHHLVPGGLLIIEPWFTPDAWKPGTVHAMLIDEPELKIARLNTSFMEGRLSYFDLHYLIATPQGTEHYVERHELGLFEVEETTSILARHGFDVTHDEEGFTGRGLYIAVSNRD
ncbi:MAG: methyltransferase domain-containing protein [Anaerolineales bacterium]|nr:methyltransferase domain-containing protein [Anaerolineales bacterium]